MENNTDLKSIGERIAKQRKLKGLTQKDLAKALHTQREIINYWEKGHRDIKTENIILLAQELGVSADYLLGLAPNPTTDEATKELCKTLNLSDASIEFLKNPENKGIVDIIDKLIDQHLLFEEHGKFFSISKEGVKLKTVFRSILSEIMLYYELCKIEDIAVKIGNDGSFAPISNDEFIVDTNYSEIRVDMADNNDFLQVVHLKKVALDECFERLKTTMQRTSLDADCIDDIYQETISSLIACERSALINAKKNSKR